MACLKACAVLAVAFCVLLPVSEAQILPGVCSTYAAAYQQFNVHTRAGWILHLPGMY